ncbi:Long-chain fatty acid transport protein [hydrothermal vent metagenome]|uniref:Long-chain fatty acid transport protein n=1 Tax=hydrothermal vent metagenome TaxID=652676 RepID=A0A1W1BDP2_9ZZZZ
MTRTKVQCNKPLNGLFEKILITSIVASSMLVASGYKIPETSTNSVALSGANIAHTRSSDAAYDNPANMIFMEDTNHIEADLMYIGLSGTKFNGTVSTTTQHSMTSEEQTFIIPSVHYVSPKLGENGVRLGLSIVVPGGLTREWKEEPAKTSAEEFTLQIMEINPTVAYEVTNDLAIAFGFRLVDTNGVVKSDGTHATYAKISRDMIGSSIDYGYNLALAYHPMDNLELATTYRSKVNLTVNGSADLSVLNGTSTYSGDASVTIPLPATFSAAAAYTFSTKTTVEFVYEVSYWSAYESLDFKYDGTVNNATAIFSASIPKNWKDTNAFRLGVTQELDSVTLMAGVVVDESPTPESTLNFESPGSDSLSVSLGGRYQIDESLDVGLSVLYSMKEDRDISSSVNVNKINGTFSNSNALLISAGLGYKF